MSKILFWNEGAFSCLKKFVLWSRRLVRARGGKGDATESTDDSLTDSLCIPFSARRKVWHRGENSPRRFFRGRWRQGAPKRNPDHSRWSFKRVSYWELPAARRKHCGRGDDFIHCQPSLIQEAPSQRGLSAEWLTGGVPCTTKLVCTARLPRVRQRITPRRTLLPLQCRAYGTQANAVPGFCTSHPRARGL